MEKAWAMAQRCFIPQEGRFAAAGLTQQANKFTSFYLKINVFQNQSGVTGVRKGEICGLNWSDINFEQKVVSIKRQYEAVSGSGLIITKPKTLTSYRDFTISDCLIELFIEYRNWYDKKKEEVGNKWEGVDDAIFIGRYGKRLHPTTIRNWFDEALELAGIKHYCVHSLRHTNVTLLLDANVPVVTVSQRVGHAKSSTTLNIYADHLVESDREASNKLGSYFEQVEKNNI